MPAAPSSHSSPTGQVAPSGPTSRRPAPTSHRLTVAALLSPAGLILVALVLVPLGFLIYTSFTDYSQQALFTGQYQFVAFDQYLKVFSDPKFYAALVRTFLFTAALVIGSVLIGMWVAQLMTKVSTPLRYLLTFVLIFAWAMPNVASSMVWRWLFQPGYGVINWLLTRLGIFGDLTNTAWSNNTTLAFITIWLLVVWQAVPYIAITLYAATTQIDRSCLEAAAIDGASPLRAYWQITVPLIKPSIMVITMLSIIWDFNVFNQIWLVSGGGPQNSTATIGVFTYKQAFVNFAIGQGAAISVVTSLILLVLTAIYIRNLLRTGEKL